MKLTCHKCRQRPEIYHGWCEQCFREEQEGKMGWEKIDGPTSIGSGGTYTHRLKVPRGWLYRINTFINDEYGCTFTSIENVVFVPGGEQ